MNCWELPQWPNFTYDRAALTSMLNSISQHLYPLLKQVAALPEENQRSYLFERLVVEVQNTSSIEGELYSREDIRSSLLNNMTLGYQTLNVRDKRAIGIGKVVHEVVNHHNVAVTESMIKYWHSLLFEGNTALRSIGDYRLGPEPMRIISGSPSNPIVHYEAPPADTLTQEMNQFVIMLDKRHSDDPLVSGILLAGLSHLHFESIHPFEDGNGRIGRALIDYRLSHSLGVLAPFSISQSLQLRQPGYYAALNSGRKDLDATQWMIFYLEAVSKSIRLAKQRVKFVLQKTLMLSRLKTRLSKNQEKALIRLFDAGPEGFKGGFSAKNYANLTRVSKPTATRDLSNLVALGALLRTGAGRATRYELNLAPLREEE